MATAEQYAEWIVKNHALKGTPEFETVAQAYKAARVQTAAPVPAAEAEASPTGKAIREGLGATIPLGEYLPDVLMGGRQVLDAAAQMAARATGLGVEDTERVNREALAAYKQTFGGEDAGAGIARGAGQGLATGPLAPALKGAGMIASGLKGAGAGAVGGVLTPVYEPGENFWQQKGEQLGLGGGVGGAIGTVMGAAGKVLSPVIGAAQKALHEAGIRLTPGQAAGGWSKAIEDKLTSVPVIGDLIKSRRFEGITDFNRAVYSKAVAPFGDEGAAIVKSAPVGREGIDKVGNFLSSKYEEALARSVPNPLDQEFQAGMVQLSGMVPEAMRREFVSVVERNIVSKLTPEGTLTPSVAKKAESELGRLASEYRGSNNPEHRELSRALRQAQEELRELVARNNPETAPMIRAANEGWRTLVQMESAGSLVGARDGIFTPAQFLSAGVKRSDKSPRDRDFARRRAFNQKFVEQARDVLPSEVPNSGTVDRMLAAGLPWGIAGGVIEPNTLVAGGAGAIPFLPGVSPFLARMIAGGRPQSMVSLGELTRSSMPYLAAPAGGLAANQ